MSSEPTTLADLLARSGSGFDTNRGDFDILNRALADAGLTAALDDADADLTLLAPTDAAFIRLAESLGFTGEGEEAAYQAIATALAGLAPGGDPIPLLRDILLYHVVGESLTRQELLGRTEVPTLLEGASINPFANRLGDADPSATDPRLIGRGREADNGRIFTIDNVLLPVDVPGNGTAPAQPTLAELLAASGTGFDADLTDFDVLNFALDATGLTAALDDAGADLTLFAPTDAAFLSLARAFGFDGDGEQAAAEAILEALGTLVPGGDGIALLRTVLQYHVVEGGLSAAQARAAGTLETLAGTEITVRGAEIRDADPDIADPRLIAGRGDVQASNGALQAIDGVLLPQDLDLPAPGAPTLEKLVAASGEGFDDNRRDFDMLKAALDAAGLTNALGDPDANLTLFAPTDAAFLRLARDLGYQGGDEGQALQAILDALAGLSPNGDPLPLLTEVLTYHVAPEALNAREVRRSTEIETLAGESIAPFGRRLVDLDPTLPDAKLVARGEQEASNGVLHAIDRVLLPTDIPEAAGSAQAGTIAEILARSGEGFDDNAHDFDLLNAALAATGLDEALAGDTLLTLLAPTDAAFKALAEALGDESGTEQGALDTILEALGALGGGDPLPVLEDVLLQHVIGGRFSREQLVAGREADPLEGPELQFRGARILDAEPGAESRFVGGGSDQFADNGVVHAISGVLLPLNLDVI